jgi:ribonucleoside-diphosphate reductase alpha chain
MNVLKREGYTEVFDQEKIYNAIMKAMIDTKNVVELVAEEIGREIENEIKDGVTIEEIQDLVEVKLMEKGLKGVAKSFIIHRNERTKGRQEGWKLNELQQAIFDNKYRYNNETFDQWVERVSGGNKKIAKLIKQKKFLFAGRILAHRGLQNFGHKVTYSNCYVMPRPEDNIEDIFDSAKRLARTYSYGGGCGIDISNLRPKGAKVNNSAKETSGATSFMELFDVTTALIGQNGRRGALMISCVDTHPDLEQFIDIKTKDNSITKANISIRVSNGFMMAVIFDNDWVLKWEGEDGTVIEKTVRARELFKKNAQNNWDWAEAGMLYWDTIKRWHLMSEHPKHEFAGVNPCAEEPLMAGGSCLLGSLNLSEFVDHPFTDHASFDLDKFGDAVMIATIGLNEVLDEGLSLHPLKIQRDNARDWRQIGLGVMGIADMFIKLGIEYGSKESVKLSHKIGHTLLNMAILQSSFLAQEQGTFPKYDEKALFKSEFFLKNISPMVMGVVKEHGLRNSQILTIAPTGSLSTMFGISGGIEPIFATHYTRKTESLHDEGEVVYTVYTDIVKEYMDKTGTKEIPSFIKTSHDLYWKDRVLMQGTWQTYIDASISSTVNLPNNATVEEVQELFIEAWKHNLKGITIFREGCKRAGILTTAPQEKEETPVVIEYKETNAYEDNKKFQKCSECGEPIEVVSGACTICLNCGHSPCS